MGGKQLYLDVVAAARDGTIYGRGKTNYMLIESIFTNGLYYVTMFVLWKTGVWVPTLDGIALMFGIGMAIDLIPTVGCYVYLLKREKVRIHWTLKDVD